MKMYTLLKQTTKGRMFHRGPGEGGPTTKEVPVPPGQEEVVLATNDNPTPQDPEVGGVRQKMCALLRPMC